MEVFPRVGNEGDRKKLYSKEGDAISGRNHIIHTGIHLLQTMNTESYKLSRVFGMEI